MDVQFFGLGIRHFHRLGCRLFPVCFIRRSVHNSGETVCILEFLRRGFSHPQVIFCLLFRCERRVKHLQFQSLHHIFSFAKPKDQFITFLNTIRHIAITVVEVCQLISPFFFVFSLFEFLQDIDTVLQACILRLI